MISKTPAQKAIEKAKREALQNAYETSLRMLGMPMPVKEYKAIPERDFRFDFAWPAYDLLVEIQGGTYAKEKDETMRKGGHNTGTGIARDNLKGNLAVMHGWFLLRFDSKDVATGEAALFTRSVIEAIEERRKHVPFET